MGSVCLGCVCFKRTGIFTNNVVRCVMLLLFAVIRVVPCTYVYCACLGVLTVGKHLSPIVLKLIYWNIVNWICHMLQPIIENVNSSNADTFLLWHLRCCIASAVQPPATQRNALRCNQSNNHSRTGKMGWEVLGRANYCRQCNVWQIDSNYINCVWRRPCVSVYDSLRQVLKYSA